MGTIIIRYSKTLIGIIIVPIARLIDRNIAKLSKKNLPTLKFMVWVRCLTENNQSKGSRDEKY